VTGIVGIISQRPVQECCALVDMMAGCLKHESFYTSGVYFAPDMGVYGGWVAHERSFASDPSLHSATSNTALLFSGECHTDLNSIALSKAAPHWTAALYQQMGERFVEHLNGLFGGLLIDKARRKALLFNDRYGFGRIYWYENDEGFYFASEAKALLRILPQLRSFDDVGLAQFLALGTTIEDRTLFRSIRVLPAASAWLFENGTRHSRTYFSSDAWERQSTLSSETFQEEFEATFKRIVPRYCTSESRIGISLTAGLDSRMVVACLPPLADRPVCYTYAGQRGETLDARLASKVAAVCNLDHSLLRISTDFFSEFAEHVDRTVYLTDGYFGVVGAHEVYLNRQARKLAPVRLTGIFGGEVLRSVSTFKPINLAPQLLNPELQRTVSSFAMDFAATRFHPVTFAAFKEIPWATYGTVTATASQVTVRSPYLDNDIVALAFRAPAQDRRSADSAVRMLQNVSPSLANVPTDMGLLGKQHGISAFLKQVLSKVTFKLDYIFNEGMPHRLSRFDAVFDRLNGNTGLLGLHKYLHYRRWFRRELSDYVRSSLNSSDLRHDFWNASFVRELHQRHYSGERNYVGEISAVLTLDAVRRLMFHPS